jgi:hypothetical protein
MWQIFNMVSLCNGQTRELVLSFVSMETKWKSDVTVTAPTDGSNKWQWNAWFS